MLQARPARRARCACDQRGGLELEGHGDVAALAAFGAEGAHAAAKPSSGIRRLPYSTGSPVSAAKRAWIHGDLLWATGLPMTQ
jgi:hypothetical protein